LDTTGGGGVVCACHGCIRPLGFGDLQRGERCNMDYIVFSAVNQGANSVKDLDISYDVACVWIKKLQQRIPLLPPGLREFAMACTVRPLIPKFHLPGHMKECQAKFSWHLLSFLGVCDGEEIERFWAAHNDAGRCTKEMAPSVGF
ncbi:hypothetical protein M422DRAFT_142131, partial [Sphaerobolus stellatus SS14]